MFEMDNKESWDASVHKMNNLQPFVVQFGGHLDLLHDLFSVQIACDHNRQIRLLRHYVCQIYGRKKLALDIIRTIQLTPKLTSCDRNHQSVFQLCWPSHR